jgi:hypothetical protein
VIGDVNRDGRQDMVVAVGGGSDLSIILGREGGRFEVSYLAAGKQPKSLAMGDINTDGGADLLVADAEVNSILTLLGSEDGRFLTYYHVTAGDRPHSVILDDVNTDGDLDVVVANENSKDISVYSAMVMGVFSNSGVLRRVLRLGGLPW